MRAVVWFCVSLMLLIGGASAQPAGDILTAVTAEQLAGTLQKLGYRAQIETDEFGTYITSNTQGYTFHIEFYNCAGTPQACSVFQYYSEFDLDTPTEAAFTNDFNESFVFGNAYMIDKRRVAITLPYSLEGGVATAYLAATVATWEAVFSDFLDHLAMR